MKTHLGVNEIGVVVTIPTLSRGERRKRVTKNKLTAFSEGREVSCVQQLRARLERYAKPPSSLCFLASGPWAPLDVSTSVPEGRNFPSPQFFRSYCLVETILCYLSEDSFYTKLDTRIPNLPFDFFPQACLRRTTGDHLCCDGKGPMLVQGGNLNESSWLMGLRHCGLYILCHVCQLTEE